MKDLIDAIQDLREADYTSTGTIYTSDVIDLINTHMAGITNQIKADGIREALNNVERTFTLQHKDASILGAPATVDYHALLKYARLLSTIAGDE